MLHAAAPARVLLFVLFPQVEGLEEHFLDGERSVLDLLGAVSTASRIQQVPFAAAPLRSAAGELTRGPSEMLGRIVAEAPNPARHGAVIVSTPDSPPVAAHTAAEPRRLGPAAPDLPGSGRVAELRGWTGTSSLRG